MRAGDITQVQMPDILDVKEVSKYLRIPRSTVYRLAQEGSIPCRKVGKHWRFHRGTLDEWLSQSRPE